MGENESEIQLEMIWPAGELCVPEAPLPAGYALRTYRQGDEPGFYRLMERAGWPGWDGERLRPWVARLLPEGWFMIVHEASARIVASVMALRSAAYPTGGEVGWLAGDPDHAGLGLGLAVTAAVTRRFVEGCCRPIHLYTEHYRLAALKTYLRFGYVPLLHLPEMPERWREICEQLGLPFSPDVWRSRAGEYAVAWDG